MKKGILILLALILALPAYGLEMSIVGAQPDSEVKLNLGGDVRLRWYDFNNFWDFDDQNDADDYQTFRLRTRLYTKATLSDGVSGFVRIANQTYGEGNTLNGAGKNMDGNVFVDNAYIDIKNFANAPIDLRLGRQNLMYGSGFVLFDGESQFASTAIYFDAVKLTWHMAENAKMDLIYAIDEENNRADNPADDITVGGAYITANLAAIGDQQEIYVLNRRDEALKKDIWMGGLRLSDKTDFGLDYSAEAAMQTGDAFYDAAVGKVLDQDALGYKVEVGYSVPTDGINIRPFIGYASLSGDKKAGDDDFEGWDVFYGGWPQFGDLLAWTAVNLGKTPLTTMATNYENSGSVTGEANYSNLNLATVGFNLGLGKLKTTLSYTQLTIDEKDTATASAPVAFENDDDYGDYYQLQMKYPYTKALSFSLYAAMIKPGDAFPNTNDDTAHEFFIESNLSF